MRPAAGCPTPEAAILLNQAQTLADYLGTGPGCQGNYATLCLIAQKIRNQRKKACIMPPDVVRYKLTICCYVAARNKEVFKEDW